MKPHRVDSGRRPAAMLRVLAAVLAVTAVTGRAADLKSGLLAYYGFEQAGAAGLANLAPGATGYDAERIGDGTDWLAGAHPTGPGFEGNPEYDGGNGLSDRSTLISGKALNLVGTRDELVRIPLGVTELGQSFTIAAWHHLSPGANNTASRYYVFEAQTNYDISWGTLAQSASGGPLAAHNYAAWFANRSDSSLSVNGVPAGAWHHIVHVFTREGSGTRMTVFLNGSQVGTKSFSSVNMTFDAIKLGDARDGQARTWDGMIDEVMLWDRALSNEEVNDLHVLYMTGQTVLDHTAGPTGFAGGTGVEGDPFLIETAEQLNAMRLDLGAHYRLEEDVDLTAMAGWNGGQGWLPVGSSYNPFQGTFDGNGHTISNLAINRPATDYQGLFGYVNGGRIERLHVVGVDIAARDRSGGLVGQVDQGGVVSGCTSAGTLSAGTRVGGLVGVLQGVSRIHASGATGDVTGTGYVGGLVGQSVQSVLQNVGYQGTVQSTGEFAGGLVGQVSGGQIYIASVDAGVTGAQNTGGLVGWATSGAFIHRVSVQGAVAGSDYVGGMFGSLWSGDPVVTDGFTHATVGGTSQVGGLVGSAGYCQMQRVYSTGTVAGGSHVGGLIGRDHGGVTAVSGFWDTESSELSASAGGTGRLTAEMKQQATYFGYDFARRWAIEEGVGYPVLQDMSGYSQGPTVVALADLQGDGTTGEPYLLTTPSELHAMRLDPSAHYRLGADIDLADTVAWDNGQGWLPVGNTASGQHFTGAFDGAGFAIGNLAINRPATDYQGLFGYVNGGRIENLHVAGFDITARDRSGGLAGQIEYGGVVSTCTSAGTISARTRSGGLVGASQHGSRIEYSSSSATVIGSSERIGGLAGQSWTNGVILECFATGTVSGTTLVGGLVGNNSTNSRIDDSHAAGAVTGSGSSVGGLAGQNETDCVITGSHATGAVGGAANVGGLVGYNLTRSRIEDSHATGAVTATNERSGGLVGYNLTDCVIVRSHATGAINGTARVGGLVGYHGGDSLILDCFAEGAATGTGNQVGGLVGYHEHSRVLRSVALGAATGATRVGGLVGAMAGDRAWVEQSYARGAAQGTGLIGGLVGSLEGGRVIECYSVGAAGGSNNVGGLVGSVTAGTRIERSYWNVTTSGRTTSAGDGGHGGKPTEQMVLPATYVGWDFATTWGIGHEGQYSEPYLLAGEPGHIVGVSLESPWAHPVRVTGLDGVGNTLTGHYVYHPGDAGDAESGTTFRWYRALTANGPFDLIPEATGTTWVQTEADVGQYLKFEVTVRDTADRADAPRGAVHLFLDGTGLADDPWQIATPVQLDNLRQFLGAAFWEQHFRLVADIDLGAAPWSEGEGWVPVGTSANAFQGRLDGNGHAIQGLTLVRPATNYQGLFGTLNGAVVQHLAIEDAAVQGAAYTGALAGSTTGATLVDRVTVTGSVQGGNYTGGAVGHAAGGSALHGVAVDATVQGANEIGGVAGRLDGSAVTLYHSSARGTVSGTSFVGGLVGVHANYGMVSDCFSWAETGGDSYTGGLIGYLYYAYVRRSYSTGLVTGAGSYVGGFAGRNYGGESTDCYWDTESSEQASSPVGAPRTPEQMADRENYRQWNFNTLWTFQGEDAPPVFQDLSMHALPRPVRLVELAGDGSAGNPYQVDSLDALNAMRDDPRAHYRLTADIDMAATVVWDGGRGWQPIGAAVAGGRFSGRFDGGGHQVSNLTINRPLANYQGLFGQVENGQVEFLRIAKAEVRGQTYTAAAVGSAIGSSALHALTVDAVVQGANEIGGVAGRLDGSAVTLYHSAAKGTVRGTSFVGGLVGVHANYGMISDCFSWAKAEGDSYVGGLIGYNYYAYVRRSYSTGLVTGAGSYVGGFEGRNLGGESTDCYWDTESSEQESSPAGTGLPGATLAQRATFRNWNFFTLWSIEEGEGYPELPDLSGLAVRQHLTPEALQGEGTAASPYLVTNVQELDAMRHDLTAHYQLAADIDLAPTVAWDGGRGWTPVGGSAAADRFRGRFNGAGFILRNLAINRSKNDYQALIAYAQDAVIEGLVFEQASVQGQHYTATLAGWADNCAISRIDGTGQVNAVDDGGGLVGRLNGGRLFASAGDVSIRGRDRVGGLVGYMTSGSSLIQSFSRGSVTGRNSVGGVVGRHDGLIVSDCYSRAAVMGAGEVGGLVGYLYYSRLRRGYSAGPLSGSGSDVGGYVGRNLGGTEADGFWDETVSGRDVSAGGSARTTDQMKQQATYGVFNFQTIWRIEDGIDYPTLQRIAGYEEPPEVALDDLDGTGTAEDPYLVTTPAALRAMSQNLAAHYRLGGDLDLSDSTIWNAGSGWVPIGASSAPFTGIFDGGGYAIRNLTINRPESDYQGFFGYLQNATVRNLRLEGVTVYGNRYLGILAGRADNSTIDNVTVSGLVRGHNNEIGGLVGYVNGGTIHRAVARVGVLGGSYVGGLVGYTFSSGLQIRHCVSFGQVAGTGNSIGGLVGWHRQGTMADCYSGSGVQGGSSVGGLVGYAGSSGYWGNVHRCFSVGAVGGGSNVGGLIGTHYTGHVRESFWDSEASGQETSAGGVGAVGQTPEAMRSRETYAFFNFNTVWRIDDGLGYPEFQDFSRYELPTAVALGDLQGEGTEASPYLLHDASELNAMRLSPGAHYRLAQDIDLAETAIWNAGQGWLPVGTSGQRFTGSFDGDGFALRNLTINRPDSDYQGLFGYVQNATARNLRLADASVVGNGNIGILAGRADTSTIDNAVVSGLLRGHANEIGGLVGYVNGGSIHRAVAQVGVLGGSYVGGLVGYTFSSGLQIRHCGSFGQVGGTGNSIGGLVGWHRQGTMADCYSGAGVQGGSSVGGLVGYAGSSGYSGNVHRCFSVGAVGGSSNVGGLLGYHYTGVVMDCLWDAESSGQETSAGGVGVVGQATEAMWTRETYAFFNFDRVWRIDEGEGYPEFRDFSRHDLPVAVALGDLQGEGTEVSPYLLHDASELNAMRLAPGAHYRLAQDIDLADTAIWNAGQGWLPVAPSSSPRFTGTLDGAGFAVRNLTINRPDSAGQGLFGYLGAATVRSLRLENAHVHGLSTLGALAGQMSGAGLVEDVAVTATVRGRTDNIGGVIGDLQSAQVRRVSAVVEVGGGSSVGGLAGYTFSSSTLSQCYSLGRVRGSGNLVGGLVGYHRQGTIADCYSGAAVDGAANVGGLVGQAGSSGGYWGHADRCVSFGGVTGTSSLGGLVGYVYTGNVTDSFWDTVTTGQESSSGGGTGLPTDALLQPATFDAWNFVDVWTIEAGQSYPYHRDTPRTIALAESHRAYGNAAVTEQLLRVTGNTAWTATAGVGWITIDEGASGVGDGVVGFSLAANAGGAPRSGTITVSAGAGAARVFQIEQRALLSAAPGQRHHDAFASGDHAVEVAGNVDWTASSDAGWLVVTDGAAGSGEGTLRYRIEANLSLDPRDGVITVAGGGLSREVAIRQAGAPAFLALAPHYREHEGPASTGNTVEIESNHGWTATKTAPWLTITGGASGTGDGTLTYSLDLNDTRDVRMAWIHVQGAGRSVAFRVTQVPDLASETTLYTILTAVQPPEAGSVTPGASVYRNQYFTATATVGDAEKYVFGRWRFNGHVVSYSPNYSFAVQGSGTLVAEFDLTRFQVTAGVSPAGLGSVSGTGWWSYGVEGTLTANPAAYCSFVEWRDGTTDEVVSTSRSYTFAVTAPRHLVAVFAEDTVDHEVTTETLPPGLAEITGAGTWANGQTASFVAPTVVVQGDQRYVFQRFTRNGTYATNQPTWNWTFTRADPATVVVRAEYQAYDLSPAVREVRRTYNSPVPATDAQVVTVVFDRTMDTAVIPQASIRREGDAEDRALSAQGGQWQSLFATHDAYRYAPLTFVQGDDGEYDLTVSGAQDSFGVPMSPTNAWSFVVDATPPPLPDVAQTASGETWATVAWAAYDAPVDLQGFRVYVREQLFGSVAGLTPRAYLGAAARSYTVQSLVLDRDYWVAVMPLDQAGNMATAVTPLLVRIESQVPPPVALSVAGTAADTARLDWTGYAATSLGFAGFRVYQAGESFDDVGGMTPVATLGKSVRVHSIGGLDREQSYWFAVVGYNLHGAFDPAVEAQSWSDPFQGVVTQDLTLGVAGATTEILGLLTVENGAVVTVPAGATLAFRPGAGIVVEQGALVAEGTALRPIVLTAAVDEGQAPVAGSWEGVVLNAGAGGSRLRHVFVNYGQGLAVAGCAPTVEALSARFNAPVGLWIRDGGTVGTSDALLRNHPVAIRVDAGATLELDRSIVRGNALNLEVEPGGTAQAAGVWWGSAEVAAIEAGFSGTVTYAPPLAAEPLLTPAADAHDGQRSVGVPQITLALASRVADAVQISEDSLFAGSFFDVLESPRTVALSAGGGEKTLYVRFRNAAGEISETVTVPVNYVSGGPQITACNLAEGSVLTRPFRVTASATSPLGVAFLRVLANDVVVAQTAGATLDQRWDVRGLAPGVTRIVVQAVDPGGNLGVRAFNVTANIQPPPNPVLSAPADEIVTADPEVLVQGTAEPFATVQIRRNAAVAATVEAGNTGAFEAAVALVEGANVLVATVADDYGTGRSNERRVTLDSGPPEPVVLEAPTYQPGSGLSFGWLHPATGERPAQVALLRSAAPFETVGEASWQGPWTTANPASMTPPSDGRWYVAAAGRDLAGNISALSNRIEVDYDATPPTFTVQFDKASPSGTGLLTIEIEASEPLQGLPSVTVRPPAASGPILLTVAETGPNRYQSVYNVQPTAGSGVLAVRVTGTDLSGNRTVAATPAGPTMVLDTRAPIGTLAVDPSGLVQVVEPLPMAVTLTLNELSDGPPELTFTPPEGAPLAVALTGSGLTWNGGFDLLPTMGSGLASFSLQVTDLLGNSGSQLEGVRQVELYNTALPAPPMQVPTLLASTDQPGGVIKLAWAAVPDAESYRIYRGEGVAGMPPDLLVAEDVPGATYEDLPPEDGFHRYTVRSVRRDSPADPSPEALGMSDRTPPPPPENLAVGLSSAGVRIDWEYPTSGEQPARFRLYRNGAVLRSSLGAATRHVIDNPAAGTWSYQVASVDANGNEAFSGTDSIDLTLPAVQRTEVEVGADRIPRITWQRRPMHVGVNLYRNGVKLNATPLAGDSYADSSLTGTGVTQYEVRGVNAEGHESAGRQLPVYRLDFGLAVNPALGGTALLRYFDEVSVVVSNRTAVATFDVASVELTRRIDGAASVTRGATSAASIAAGAALPLPLVFPCASASGLQAFDATVVQALDDPSAAVRYTATLTGAAPSLALPQLEITLDTDPVAGAAVAPRVRLFNRSLLPVDVVMWDNGQPGALSARVLDAQGMEVNRIDVMLPMASLLPTPDRKRGFIRIAAQGAVTLQLAELIVPEALGEEERAFIEVRAGAVHHRCGEAAEQVSGPLSGRIPITPRLTPYAAFGTPDKAAYRVGETIVVTGYAYDRETGDRLPDVPVSVGVGLGGFAWYVSAETDEEGNFTAEWPIVAGVSGLVQVWASHPDVRDMLQQGEAAIYQAYFRPGDGSVRMPANDVLTLRLSVENPGDFTFTGLTSEFSAWKMVDGEPVPLDAEVAWGEVAGVESLTLPPRQRTPVTLTLHAAEEAIPSFQCRFEIVTPEGLRIPFDATVNVSMPLPLISVVTPRRGFVDMSLDRGSMRSSDVELRNDGFRTLEGVTLTAPTVPWMHVALTPGPDGRFPLPDLAPGQTFAFQVAYAPGEDVGMGYYSDALTIAGANSAATTTLNLYAKVTSESRGALHFRVLNNLEQVVPDATVRLRSALDGTERSGFRTDENGEVTIPDLMEGDWHWQVAASGHTTQAGTAAVEADVTRTVETTLNRQLVTVTFNVVPVPFTDRYEIRIEQTFSTYVPAPVLVVDPVFQDLGIRTEPFEHTFVATAKNHGLIKMTEFEVEGSSAPWGALTPAITYLPELLPMQQIEIPYTLRYWGETGAPPPEPEGFAVAADSAYVSLDMPAPPPPYNPCTDDFMQALMNLVSYLNARYQSGSGTNIQNVKRGLNLLWDAAGETPYFGEMVQVYQYLLCIGDMLHSTTSGRGRTDGGGDRAGGGEFGTGGFGCFVPGTPVLAGDGSWRPIESLRPGDVLRTGPRPGDLARIGETYRRENAAVLRLSLDNGESLVLTPEHRLWTDDRGWIAAGGIGVGDRLGALDDAVVTVTAVEALDEPATVHTFELYEDIAFYANGILAQHLCGMQFPNLEPTHGTVRRATGGAR